MENKLLFLKFIQQHSSGTISTATLNGMPNAATIDFTVCDDLSLLFNVSRDSIKFKNISENPNICAVFSDFQHVTVQFFGLVRPVNGQELGTFRQIYEDNIIRRLWKSDDYAFMIAKPSYIRYCNFTNHPPKIEELKF